MFCSNSCLKWSEVPAPCVPLSVLQDQLKCGISSKDQELPHYQYSEFIALSPEVHVFTALITSAEHLDEMIWMLACPH